MKITEKEIISKYLRSLTFNNNNSLNLMDDVYYDMKKKIIFSTDTYEEGIHFLNSVNSVKFIKKIFRSSISDIICKGCKPTTYFLSLSINKLKKKWLKNLKKELTKESKKFGIFLGGGDTVKSKKRLSVTISVIGDVVKKPILRSTAKINDDIYVTGNIGDSYLGLLVYLNRKSFGNLNKYFKKAYDEPILPFRFSKFLNRFASSSIDISDGLIADLENICIASKCGAHIYFSDLPISKNAKNILYKKKINFLNFFSKGDDYQILFTAHKKNRKKIDLISKKTTTKVTRLGKIVKGRLVKMTNSGVTVDLSTKNNGYIHRF